MKLNLSFHLCVICILLAFGCEESVTPRPPDGDADALGTQISERILLDASGDINPAQKLDDDIYVFELATVTLVESGEYNDFDLTYYTGTTCDEDVWIFNCQLQTWDQFSYYPEAASCGYGTTNQKHLFSAKRFKAEDYVDEESKLLLRSADIYDQYPIVLRALKMNSNYHAVPLTKGWNGITTDRKTLIVSSNAYDKIYRYSFSGEMIREYPAPWRYPFSMDFDGNRFWLTDGSDRIFALDKSMNPVSEFSVPTDFPGGLVWVHGKLWMTEYEGEQLRTFVIDSDESCDTGAAVIERIYLTPGGGARGIEYDGNHLLVLSDRLYKMTEEANVVASYELPFTYATDIAWDGRTVWIINLGPREVRTRDIVISRFRLD